MLRSRKFEAIKKETIRKRVFLFILIYLVFITAYLSVHTLSKYVGTAEGEGSIQVAKWDVRATSESNTTMNIISGYNSTAFFTPSNLESIPVFPPGIISLTFSI